MRRRRRAGTVGLVALVVAGDYVTSLLAAALGLPFYLDSWATATGVIVAGPFVGIVGGTLYNLLIAATAWEPADVVWGASSVLVAGCTWLFVRAGWIDILRPLRMVAAGVTIGIANGCLSLAIRTLVLGDLRSVDPMLVFRRALETSFGSSRLALLVQSITIEVADKSVCIITAAAVAFLLRDARRWTRTRRASPAPTRRTAA
jgi:hypothetical protein